MAKRKSSGKRVLRPEAEMKTNPESEKELKEREAIAEREKLKNEVAERQAGRVEGALLMSSLVTDSAA